MRGRMRKRFTRYEFEQANTVIHNIYRLHGHGLDIEECMSTSWEAFIEIRNTLVDISNTDMLWVLAGRKITSDLEKLRKVKNDRYHRMSKLSLNQTIGDSNEPVYAFLYTVQGDFANAVCMWNYVDSLPLERQFMLRKLYQGEEDLDIMNMMHMEPDEYYTLKLQLKEDILKYFEE